MMMMIIIIFGRRPRKPNPLVEYERKWIPFSISLALRNRSQFVICTAALEPSSITLLLSPQWLLQILLPFSF
jgi:hypothetical protein